MDWSKIKATPDQRIDAIANMWAQKIVSARFNNPEAIPLEQDKKLARDLIEPLRERLVTSFAADK